MPSVGGPGKPCPLPGATESHEPGRLQEGNQIFSMPGTWELPTSGNTSHRVQSGQAQHKLVQSTSPSFLRKSPLPGNGISDLAHR